MTPKEKAAELIVNYQLKCKSLNYDEAKQCALIAVDEMLDFRNGLYINEGSLAHKYLLDIKQEIEKL
jgi:hypothetical protein